MASSPSASCSHHDHNDPNHVCGSLPGSGVTQSMDEMKYQRGVWGAVLNADVEKLRSELVKRKHEIFETDSSGLTVLHYAARAGKEAIVKELLLAGALPNAVTLGMRATPLHRAAYMGHVGTLAALIAHGASLDMQDDEGNTALHKAAMQGHAEAVKLLLKSGANRDLEDEKGRKAIDLVSGNQACLVAFEA